MTLGSLQCNDDDNDDDYGDPDVADTMFQGSIGRRRWRLNLAKVFPSVLLTVFPPVQI